VVAAVDEWWGGRRVSDKLTRLFFRYFAETSFAVKEEEIVAFLVDIVASPAEQAYVHFVGVRPDHRSRGLGRQPYGMFFDEAGRRGCRCVRAITSPVNTGSIGSHTSMGFEVLEGSGVEGGRSVRSDYDGDGKDRVIFVREISRGRSLEPRLGARVRVPTEALVVTSRVTEGGPHGREKQRHGVRDKAGR
jgi:GNAT superfamily N-acetyltransferase